MQKQICGMYKIKTQVSDWLGSRKCSDHNDCIPIFMPSKDDGDIFVFNKM